MMSCNKGSKANSTGVQVCGQRWLLIKKEGWLEAVSVGSYQATGGVPIGPQSGPEFCEPVIISLLRDNNMMLELFTQQFQNSWTLPRLVNLCRSI